MSGPIMEIQMDKSIDNQMDYSGDVGPNNGASSEA